VPEKFSQTGRILLVRTEDEIRCDNRQQRQKDLISDPHIFDNYCEKHCPLTTHAQYFSNLAEDNLMTWRSEGLGQILRWNALAVFCHIVMSSKGVSCMQALHIV
jgi:hypothetical protein